MALRGQISLQGLEMAVALEDRRSNSQYKYSPSFKWIGWSIRCPPWSTRIDIPFCALQYLESWFAIWIRRWATMHSAISQEFNPHLSTLCPKCTAKHFITSPGSLIYWYRHFLYIYIGVLCTAALVFTFLHQGEWALNRLYCCANISEVGIHPAAALDRQE